MLCRRTGERDRGGGTWLAYLVDAPRHHALKHAGRLAHLSRDRALHLPLRYGRATCKRRQALWSKKQAGYNKKQWAKDRLPTLVSLRASTPRSAALSMAKTH